MAAQIFKPHCGHGRRNTLVPCPTLLHCQVGVKFANHQQRSPLGPLDDGRNNVLYCQGIVWGQVAPHNVPPLAARRQLKADNVRAVEVERLHEEFFALAIEHGDAPAVCACRLR